MTLFFLEVGLEAKRELDLGELRERRRLAIPVLAAVGGMGLAAATYLAINAGGDGRPRLGHRGLDGHGAGAGHARAPDGRACGAAARVPPDARRRGRPAGPGRDHVRLQQPHRRRPARRRRRAPRHPRRAAVRTERLARPGRRAHRGGVVGGAVRVRRRCGRGRARHRTGDERVSAVARGPRALDRDHALLPRAADPRARLPGPRQPHLRDLAERAPAVPPAPVDELGHRAGLRAGQRGAARRRRPPAARGQLPGDPRHRRRLPRRQADRRRARRLAGDAAGARRPAAAGHVANARDRGVRRRRRLHGLPARREPHLHRPAPGRGEGRHHRHRPAHAGGGVADAAPRPQRPWPERGGGSSRTRRRSSSTSSTTSIRRATTSGATPRRR